MTIRKPLSKLTIQHRTSRHLPPTWQNAKGELVSAPQQITKTCKDCGGDFPLDQLKKSSSSTHGRAALCNQCNRDYARFKSKGVTREQYDALSVEQDHSCHVCGWMPKDQATRRHLEIDHCHDSGEVRSLLCGRCNKMLGQARDNPLVLLSGFAYLVETDTGKESDRLFHPFTLLERPTDA